MKELMEIFQNLVLKGGNETAWINEKNNNFPTFDKMVNPIP